MRSKHKGALPHKSKARKAVKEAERANRRAMKLRMKRRV